MQTEGTNFNSTMVRLKDEEINTVFRETLFQFHDGSIKGKRGFKPLLHLIYFNSTMVRLKVFPDREPPCAEINFNSTMVRLKVRFVVS